MFTSGYLSINFQNQIIPLNTGVTIPNIYNLVHSIDYTRQPVFIVNYSLYSNTNIVTPLLVNSIQNFNDYDVVMASWNTTTILFTVLKTNKVFYSSSTSPSELASRITTVAATGVEYFDCNGVDLHANAKDDTIQVTGLSSFVTNRTATKLQVLTNCTFWGSTAFSIPLSYISNTAIRFIALNCYARYTLSNDVLTATGLTDIQVLETIY